MACLPSRVVRADGRGGAGQPQPVVRCMACLPSRCAGWWAGRMRREAGGALRGQPQSRWCAAWRVLLLRGLVRGGCGGAGAGRVSPSRWCAAWRASFAGGAGADGRGGSAPAGGALHGVPPSRVVRADGRGGAGQPQPVVRCMACLPSRVVRADGRGGAGQPQPVVRCTACLPYRCVRITGAGGSAPAGGAHGVSPSLIRSGGLQAGIMRDKPDKPPKSLMSEISNTG